MEERLQELRDNIEKWQEELDTVWEEKETDAAEVERRNLRNLIANAKREIEEIENPKTQDELGNNFDTLKDKFEEIKKANKDKEIEKNRLKMHIEKLTDERENYASQKNSSYKDIYNEYTKQIKNAEKEIEELEKEESAEEKDKQLRIITALRIAYEKQIAEKEKEIRDAKREIEDIEYGTEEAMVEKELEDETKVKSPKVLELYEKLNILQAELKDITYKKEECQKYIDKIKGIEEKQEARQLSPEEIAYFHGQGDRIENTRDDRRGNDEYFGFEKRRPEADRTKPKPIPEKPTPEKPTPEKPTPEKPIPEKPAPGKPAPGKPTPEKPAPGKPAPGKPTPEKPTPEKPTPGKPTPEKPAPGKEQEKISIEFNAKTKTYKLVNKKNKDINMELTIKDILYSDDFEQFKQSLRKEYGLENLDLFMAYMLDKADEKLGTEKLENYINAANGNERLSPSTELDYKLKGIYGRKYGNFESEFFMAVANRQEALGLADVEKGKWVELLEKYPRLKDTVRKIVNMSNKVKLLSAKEDNIKKEESHQLDTKDEEEKKNFVPTYSREALNYATKIRACKTREEIENLRKENQDKNIWSSKDDENLIKLALEETDMKLEKEEAEIKAKEYSKSKNPRIKKTIKNVAKSVGYKVKQGFNKGRIKAKEYTEKRREQQQIKRAKQQIEENKRKSGIDR